MHKTLLVSLMLTALFVLDVNLSFGQVSESAELEKILKNAEKQTIAYQFGFKDLIAKETKTYENFKSTGELRSRRLIESNFLIYESKRDEATVSEFRNVLSVDGKPVSKTPKSSAEFFEEVQKSGSIEKELRKIQDRNAKYDDTPEIYGFTLFQALILSEKLRPYFTFQIIGRQQIRDRAVFVISYNQIAETRLISSDTKNALPNELSMVYELPKPLKNFQLRLNGKLWIDTETFQLWREERKLNVLTENPFQIMSTNFEYVPSNYGFLVPKRIELVQFRFDSKNRIDDQKETKIQFDYSEFTKTKVEIEILDDEEPDEN